MHLERPWRIVCLVAALLAPMAVWAAAAQLGYRDRGNRWEGVRGSFGVASLVNAMTLYAQPELGEVRLLSARIDYRETAAALPPIYSLRFYLEKTQLPGDVSATMMDLRHATGYWMDRLKPSKPWEPERWNVFSWPTEDVMQHLPGLGAEDLGVVVRLKRSLPAPQEVIAPAIVFARTVPDTARKYVFTYAASAGARGVSYLYKDGQPSDPVQHQAFHVPGNSPFTLTWTIASSKPEWYRVVSKGTFEDGEGPLMHTVRFYHQPVVPQP